MDLSYILNHLGEDRSAYFNAMSPPIIQSSNFVFPTLAAFKEAILDESEHHVYSRGNNPTVEILRKKIAALEHAEDCLVFSSGSAAVAAAVLSQIKSGDHIICVQSAYSWTKTLIQKYLSRFNIHYTVIDGKNITQARDAIQDHTRLIYLESPTSMLLEVQDLNAYAQLAKKHHLVTIVDNSYATPLFQNPIDLGIDLVVHSGTKYLNGHSDVMIGTVCGSKEQIQKMFYNEYMTLGAIISPHDAALVIRGLRTLELRVLRSHQSASYLVEQLQTHPGIQKIYYPFINDQVDISLRQLKGGGMFTLAINAKEKSSIIAFCESLNRFSMAVSWGGYESLILPTILFYDMPGRMDPELPWNLVRFYIGLEDPELLLSDILNGLNGIS